MAEFEPSHELTRLLLGKREPWFERLLLRMNAAIARYTMLRREDGVLVGLSGGKDSLALLVMLAAWNGALRQPEEREHRIGEIRACYIENRFFPLQPNGVALLRGLCDALRVSFSVRQIEVDTEQGCFFCARARRRALVEEAEQHGLRCIALGHTQTDVVQTALLNLAQHGKLEGLEPIRLYFDDRFAIIRPLIYLDSRDTLRVVTRLSLPVQASTCPLSGLTKRAVANDAMKAMCRIHAEAQNNIARAVLKDKST